MAAFAELLYRVSNMVEDIPEITELDLNPVAVAVAVAADVRFRLTGPEECGRGGSMMLEVPITVAWI